MRFAATQTRHWIAEDDIDQESRPIFTQSVSSDALLILKRYCRRFQIIDMNVKTDGRSLSIHLNGPQGQVVADVSVESFCKGMSAAAPTRSPWLEFVDIDYTCRVQSIASHVSPAILNIVITSGRWVDFGLTVECEVLRVDRPTDTEEYATGRKIAADPRNLMNGQFEEEWLGDQWFTDTLVEVMGKRPLLSVDESKLKTSFSHAADCQIEDVMVRAMAAGVHELFMILDLSSPQAVARLNHFCVRHRDTLNTRVAVCRFDDLPQDRQEFWMELMTQSSMTHRSGRLQATAKLNPTIAEQYH